jgi:hypothetical protein
MPKAPARRKAEPPEDPVLRALAEAPEDDEPETPEERAAVAEARRAGRRGDVLTHAQLRRKLGL